MVADYTEIRDFIVLHYCLTRRDDTPFWRAYRDMVPPEGLARRIALFRAAGLVPEGIDELFRAVSWQSIMEGMGIRPARHHASADRVPIADLPRELDAARGTLARYVATVPTHGDFIARHVAAPSPR